LRRRDEFIGIEGLDGEAGQHIEEDRTCRRSTQSFEP
jgi:hypothetical protein